MSTTNPSDILQVTRQLATLTRLGFPLHDGLRTAGGPRWVGALANDLESGDDLPTALARRPRLFSEHYRALVQASLDSGDPGKGLETLAQWLERSLQVRQRVVTAVLYPLTLLIIGFLLGTVFLLFLVPEVAIPLAKTSELPALVLLFQSRLLLAVLVALGLATFSYVLIPPIRRVLRLADQTLFARGLATLLAAEKPLAESLEMLANVGRLSVLKTAFRELSISVREGSDLADLLQESEEFHPLLRWCGTQTKKQDDLILALFDTADNLEQELESTWKLELAVTEPRLMIGTGIVIALILLMAWLPVIWAGSGAWI